MALLFATYNLVSWYRLCEDIHGERVLYCTVGTLVPTRLHGDINQKFIVRCFNVAVLLRA